LITVYPGRSFSVSYLIDYSVNSIGRQVFDIGLDPDSFEKEIAPARTFCLKAEAEALLKAGLGQGATTDNTLVMGEEGPVGTELRFSDEPVRHKILDLVGDFYLLGRPVLGRIVAEKSGHNLNAKMVRRIYEKYVNKESQI
jgi:UDP-3-O-acyl-N-acetylglucosamine deacetylase